MIILREALCHILDIFREYNYFLTILCLMGMAMLAVLHHQMGRNERDLLYWKENFDYWVRHKEKFTTTAIIGVISAKLIIIMAIVRGNFNRSDNISQLEIKKRYGQYLIVRLFTEISDIEKKYVQNVVLENEQPCENILKAHEELAAVIDDFRKNARKLLAPNEREVTMPIEEVYGLLEEEEEILNQSRFSNMQTMVNDDFIKTLLNP